jgi:hypothetical protein
LLPSLPLVAQSDGLWDLFPMEWRQDIEREEWQHLIDFFSSEHPEALAQARKQIEADPDEAGEVFEHLGGFYWEYQERREDNPAMARRMLEIHRLEVRSEQLAFEVRQLRRDAIRSAAARNRREQLSGELRSLLEQIFSLKLELQRAELVQMEAELRSLQELLQLREANESEIIQRRLLELTSGRDFFEW